VDVDLAKLMEQAQRLQHALQDRQQELARQEVQGHAGAGLVTATANGRGEILRLHIDPKVFSDPALLEDLLVAAINAALRQAQELQQSEMQSLFPIPGLDGLPSSGR
jgi:DNA-binding YbaB/EbfC family protein